MSNLEKLKEIQEKVKNSRIIKIRQWRKRAILKFSNGISLCFEPKGFLSYMELKTLETKNENPKN